VSSSTSLTYEQIVYIGVLAKVNLMAESTSNSPVPKAFISYSWESDAHSQWVKELATRLRRNGVDVTLDRWHSVPGDQIAAFMERAVRENDFILAVCTSRFKERSDKRSGGVGYEGDIMTAEVFTGGNQRKFIPILRSGDWNEAAPSWLRGKAYIDLKGDPYSEAQYEDLLRTLHGARGQAPPIGPRPDFNIPPPGLQKLITNSIGMKLVLIPAGEFLMGSPDEDKDAEADEKPRHHVRITRPFYLGATEVTQEEYQKVMGQNPSWFSAAGGGKGKVAGQDTGRHPVEEVSWFDAIEFCNRLSQCEGLPPYYRSEGQQVSITGGEGYRLPTEAEWEYACRAGSQTRYSFDDDAASLFEFAWYDGNSGRTTHAVGQKRPNGFGLSDMHGNVWEWCWDWYGDEYYKASPYEDPLGPSRASCRGLRGGSWIDYARYCRPAYRYRYAPGFRFNYLGFRVARVQSGR